MTLYIYSWGNNPKRKKMKGRIYRVLAYGKMSSVLIESIDTIIPEHVITDRRALRLLKPSRKVIKR